ncbi:MAG: hypothetical protein KDN19_00605 [Verrucomicrobiae bacterium]|nr:hypothetical protein [Verrucomicrobiae bacterium]
MKTALHFLAFFLLCLAPRAEARRPIDRILLPKDVEDRDSFGTALAVNDRWIAVGDPSAEVGKGVVTIYSAATGRRLRELRAPDADDGDAFGSSLSLCGNKLLIGAPEYGNSTGVAYLMDVRNGRLIHRILAGPAVSQDKAGAAVALSERYMVIGLRGRGSSAGVVEIHNTVTGEFERRISADDAAAGDEFGKSLSVHGELVLVGAPEKGSGAGAAYLFDLRSGRQLRKLTSPNPAGFKFFGRDIALDGTRAIVGEPGTGTDGRAYLFDLLTTDPPVAFPAGGGSFGWQAELDGNLALIGAPDDGIAYLFDVSRMELLRILSPSSGSGVGQNLAFCGDQALFGVANSGGGSVHFLRPLVGPLPMETVTQTRNYAPGTVQGDFRNFQQPLINPDGEVFFTANLMGPGTAGGKNQGLWTNFQGELDSLGVAGGGAEVVGPGLKVGRLLRFVSSRDDSVVFESLLRGPGITPANNRVILTFDGAQANQLRTGTPLAALGDAEIQSMQEILQTSQFAGTTTDRLLLPYRLRRGAGGVTATDDTGALLADSFGGAIGDTKDREGQPAKDGATFGQFFGRAAAGSFNYYGFSAFVIPAGGGSPLRQCYTTSAGGDYFSVVREGDQAPGLGGELNPAETFRSVLGEVVDSSGYGIARARRGGTPSANRFAEGFWREDDHLNLRALMVGRGTELAGTSHPVTGQPLGSFLASRFLRFWPVGTDQLIVLLKGYGPGTNASNDCAVVHMTRYYNPIYETYACQVLLREGDPVPAGDCPQVRAIQRVEVDPITGHYAIVASLTGSPARNQALFVGNAGLPHPNPDSGQGALTRHALRLPRLALRKGTIFNTPDSGSTRLRSILMQPIVDRTGAGGKGHGQVLNFNGELVLCLSFDDGAKEMVVGKP